MPTSITISGKAQVKVKVLLKGSTTYIGWSTKRLDDRTPKPTLQGDRVLGFCFSK